MCASAFFAALRVGEITISSKQPPQSLLGQQQIFQMRNNLGRVAAFKFVLVNFKHSDPQRPVDIYVYRDTPVCPVATLLTFIQLRGSAPGPLFCWPDNSPVSRSFFVTCLNQALDFCGLDKSKYKSHSFRIGAASWAAAKGLSDNQIRRFGRWKSNAFLKYIRTATITDIP